MHWGFDIVHFIKENSGLETGIEHIDNLDYGIRAELIEVLVSKKETVKGVKEFATQTDRQARYVKVSGFQKIS